jgi:serine/threonine-protein kinase
MQGDRVIRIARQLCEALDHAHSRGVIHRDFKPDNILLIDEGGEDRVKVADFGLALSQNDDVRLTMTGVACTPAYAAPEQLRGDAIDSRVDLYALGTAMFEMLTGGMLPFDSDLQGTIRMKLAGEAPNLATIVPDMQPALATLVARLLSYDPDRRPRSARSLMIALDAALKAPKRKLRTQDLAPQAKGHTVSFPPTKAQRAATKRLRKAQAPGARTYAALAIAAVMIGAALASLIRDVQPKAEARTLHASEPAVTMTVQAQPVAAAVPAVTSAPVVSPVAQPVHDEAPAIQPTPRKASTPKRVVPRVVQKRAPIRKPVAAPPVTTPVVAPAAFDPTPTQPEAVFEETSAPAVEEPVSDAPPSEDAADPIADTNPATAEDTLP